MLSFRLSNVLSMSVKDGDEYFHADAPEAALRSSFRHRSLKPADERPGTGGSANIQDAPVSTIIQEPAREMELVLRGQLAIEGLRQFVRGTLTVRACGKHAPSPHAGKQSAQSCASSAPTDSTNDTQVVEHHGTTIRLCVAVGEAHIP